MLKERSTFDKVMIILIFVIIGIITAGTVFGIVIKNPEENFSKPDTVSTERQLESLNKKLDEKVTAYTGLGTIRAVTTPSENQDFGVAVVITPWFSYPEGNKEFYEELSKKRIYLKSIFTNYFSYKTMEELTALGEEKIKVQLIELLNKDLSLGEIDNLYFTDYIFLQ